VREKELSNFPIRILVTDDFEPFRRFLCQSLQTRSDFEVVGEAGDGLEAVHKTNQLHPDLVVLDIGLPRMNGIEAAARIFESCPSVKVLFVTQETSTDVLQRAFAVGVQGYVIKSEAGRDLLNAVDAVLGGKQFISRRFSGAHASANTSHPASIPDNLPTCKQRRDQVSPRHNVLFHTDDEYFLNALAQFVGSALSAMNPAIVIATESHRSSLLLKLQASGLDVEAAVEEGRYISLDAATIVSSFMVSGQPDPDRVLRGLCELFASAMNAARGAIPRVAACGECSPLLCAEGKAEAAFEVERLTNQAAELYDVEILCTYPLSLFQGEQGRSALEQIAAEHSVVHYQHDNCKS
jgi:DNA-binding NarL/FixJ family response regulator